jgi:hypothetical protein
MLFLHVILLDHHGLHLVICLFPGNEKGAAEHFLTRFSVHRIRKLVPHLVKDEDRKGWIALSGHGSLLSMSEFSIPVKLVKWIMQHIDPLLCEFRLDDKVIIFDRPLVCKILGFENGNKPLDLSGDVGRVLCNEYMDGNRAKLRKCIQVLKSSKDRDSFMRAFMLLALGSVYCPGTANAVCLNYLHSLYDVSKIKEFDWAGHILEMLMEEVKKYQKLSPKQLERNHNIAGCLAILAVRRLPFTVLLSMCCTVFKSLHCFVFVPCDYLCADCVHGSS